MPLTTHTTGATLSSLVGVFLNFINTLIPLLAGFALILFLWGGVHYVYNSSETKGRAEGRQAIIWSIIALFVLFSIWGILGLLTNSLLPGSQQGSGGSSVVPTMF